MDLGTISSPPNMTVEVDVYSGRVNPEWNLDSREAANVFRLLKRELATDIETGPLEPLGYRGFIIRIKTPVGTRRIYVHNGLSRLERDFYRDAGRELEISILAMMPTRLKDDLRDVLP